MIFKTILALTILAISAPAQSAPYKLTREEADDVFTHNGLAAQKQNADFASRKVTDSCQSGEIACVESAFAQCVNSKWVLTKCATGACFAVPETNRPGTALVCEQKEAAATRFAGVTGGVDGKSSDAPGNVTSAAPSPSPAAPPVTSTTAEVVDPECEGEEGDGEELLEECEYEDGEEEDPEGFEECDDPSPAVTKRQVIPLEPLEAEPSLAVDPSGGIPPIVPTLVPPPTGVAPTDIPTVIPIKPLSSPGAPISTLSSNPPSVTPPAVPPVVPAPGPADGAVTTVTVTRVVTVTVTQGAQATPSAISQSPVISGSVVPPASPSDVILSQPPPIPPSAGAPQPTAPVIISFQIISGSAPAPSASEPAQKAFSNLGQPTATGGVLVADPNITPAPAPSSFPTLDKEAFESMLTAAVTP